MRLITGPLASGKTTKLLAEFREALPQGAVLLVPTATMAEHLRNSLVREGLIFAPSRVTTLSKLVNELAPDVEVVSTAALHLICESVLERHTEYRSVSSFAGFRRSLVGTIEEMAAAGVSPSDVGAAGADAFSSAYRDVAAEVAARGWAFGHKRMMRAALAVAAKPPASKVFLDGFYSFTPGELAVVEALGNHAEVTLTLPVWRGSEHVFKHLHEALPFSSDSLPSGPAERLVAAANAHEEVSDIARRILKARAAGTPFREIGVIIRSEDQYGPALQAAFARFNIPARFYFAPELRTNPTVRYFCGLIELILTDWDNTTAAAILRLPDSKIEASAAGDEFEKKLRSGHWKSGLDSVLECAQPSADDLRATHELRDMRLSPPKWAERLLTIFDRLAAPQITDRVSHERAAFWRDRGQAIGSLQRAIQNAVAFLPKDIKVPLAAFWHVLSSHIEFEELRVNDHRRDVVHVIDAYEARQWSLPVVFVCGLLEGQFPKHHTEHPILPDAVRRRLQSRGFQVPASEERQRDEEFLFEIAVTRAQSRTVLTYPKANAKGDANLRSFVVDKFMARHAVATETAACIRPAPALEKLPARRAVIYDESLHARLRSSAAYLGPTSIEAFLQCPFQFFANRTLKLTALPKKPADRMNLLVQGDIVHATIERVCKTGELAETALDRAFTEHSNKHKIPPSYRLEAIRLELLYNIRKFLAENKLNLKGVSELELEVELPLDEFTTIRGRIDRLEFDERGRPTIIDLKYKKPEKVRRDVSAHREGRLVQGGLYLLAAQQRFGELPAGMLYCSTKNKIEVRGWVAGGRYRGMGSDCSEEELVEMMQASRQAALDALVQIRSGRIEPEPFDQGKCEYCNAKEVCRWEVSQPAVKAGGVA